MKHKHYEIIVAKAANMDLVVFVKTCDNGAWYEKGDNGAFQWWEDSDYFLCLPQHKEACLNWLNGGEIQEKGFYNECEFGNIGIIDASKWHDDHIFMDNSSEFRIKPRKEKRWIGYCANTNQTFPHPQKTIEIAEDYAARNYGYKMSDWKFIEIEVEV